MSAAPRGPRRLLGAFEVATALALYFVAVWVLGPHVRTAWARLTFYALVLWGAVHVLWVSPRIFHADPPELRGWGAGGLSRSDARERLRAYGGLTLVATAGLILVALARDPTLFHRIVWRSVWVKLALYLPFAFVQDMFVFAFMMTRLRDVIPRSSSGDPSAELAHRARVVSATAAIFAALHVPNVPLMSFTFVAGLCWAWLFYARPSIGWLALSHSLLGTVLHRMVELHMRIGPFYWEPKRQVLRVVVPGMDALIGDLY